MQVSEIEQRKPPNKKGVGGSCNSLISFGKKPVKQ